MTRRVPLAQAGKALLELENEILEALERGLILNALKVGYPYSVSIAPVAEVEGGTARYNLNPSAGEPEPLLAPQQGGYPAPGNERVEPLRERFGDGTHGFITFHSFGKGGVFDYSGLKLEDGYSSQAPHGVMKPTKDHIESKAGAIASAAVADTLREVA